MSTGTVNVIVTTTAGVSPRVAADRYTYKAPAAAPAITAFSFQGLDPATIGAIQRQVLVLENQGAEHFFGEPALDIMDFLRTDRDGRGVVNILAGLLRPDSGRVTFDESVLFDAARGIDVPAERRRMGCIKRHLGGRQFRQRHRGAGDHGGDRHDDCRHCGVCGLDRRHGDGC